MSDFVETNLLLAALNDDDEVLRLAQDMLPNERCTLGAAMGAVMRTLDSFCVVCDQVIPEGRDTPRPERRVSPATVDASGSCHARCFPGSR